MPKCSSRDFNYIKFNQQKIRVDHYIGWTNAIAKGFLMLQCLEEINSTLKQYWLPGIDVPYVSGCNDNSDEHKLT